jgi:hypothetical protein
MNIRITTKWWTGVRNYTLNFGDDSTSVHLTEDDANMLRDRLTAVLGPADFPSAEPEWKPGDMVLDDDDDLWRFDADWWHCLTDDAYACDTDALIETFGPLRRAKVVAE